MVNPSITRNGVTFTFDDGNVENIKVNKDGTLDETTLPATDSDGTFVLDINGVKKVITLTGKIQVATTTRTSTGTTLTIEDQVAWLLNLVDGGQTGYTFNSNFQTNKRVYARKFEFIEVAGQINHVPFTLELVEGV